MPQRRTDRHELFASLPLLRACAIEARAFTVEVLEGRAMLSGSPVSVKFMGNTYNAIEGEYVVAVNSGVDFTKLAAKAGFTDVSALGTDEFFTFSTSKTPKQVESWAKSVKTSLSGISPNSVHYPASTVNDTFYNEQYYLKNVGGQLNPSIPVAPSVTTRQTGTANADINAENAWNITHGEGTIVAVLDTGLNVAHGDLAANVWVNPGEVAGDGIDNDGDGLIDDINGWNFVSTFAPGGTNDLTDTVGHGTAVAGTIAAVANNAKGVTGIAYGAKVMPIKVFEGRTTTDALLIQGMNYVVMMARRGINIAAVNLSLPGVPPLSTDPVFQSAVRNLESAGVVFVTAAGNEGVNNDFTFSSPSNYSGRNFPNVLTVAATDNQDKLASFSNYGFATVQVAAPGVDIFTTTSNIVPSQSDDTAIPTAAEITVDGTGDRYVNISGTSFSTPLTAGIIALLKSAYPAATPAQLVKAVEDGVDKVAGLQGVSAGAQPLVTTGGRVDAYDSLRAILNRVAGSNSTTFGDWAGRYGTRGRYIFGDDVASTSTFEQYIRPGGSGIIPAGTTVITSKTKASKVNGDNRFALSQAGAGLRSSSYLFADGSTGAAFIGLDLDTGSQTTTRRLTVYAADVDNRGISQTVQIVDTLSGKILDSVPMAKFQKGQYVSFDITGQVRLQIVGGKKGAVLNAVFMDDAPTGGVASNPLANGNWNLTGYGDQGSIIAGSDNLPPSWATFSTNASVTVAAAKAKNLLAPETASGARSGNLFVAPTAALTYNLNINVTGTQNHYVTLYTYNTGKTARNFRITHTNASGTVVSTIDVNLGNTGNYFTFEVAPGQNTFTVTSLDGTNPGVAGIFFSDKTTNFSGDHANFVSSDTTTLGRWRGVYGSRGSFIFGTSSSYPTYPSVTDFLPRPSPFIYTPATGGSTVVLSANSRNPSALLNPNIVLGGVLGYYSTQTSEQVLLTPTPEEGTNNQRVTAYFLDADKKNRVQDVEIIDPATNTVVSKVRLRDFSKGIYLTYNTNAPVILRVTRVSGPSAVISGIFFD